MNRVNPILTTKLGNFVRATANGLVTNGRVILFFFVCIGAAYMARGLLGLAVLVDEPPQSPQELVLVSEKIDESAEALQEPARELQAPKQTFLQASDERIDEHYRCTYTEYRRINEDSCTALDRKVADAIRREIDKEGLR